MAMAMPTTRLRRTTASVPQLMPAGAARDLCLGQAAYDGQQEQRDACNERRMKRSGVAPVSMTAGIGTRRQNASWYLSEKESSAIYVTRLPCGTRRADAVHLRGEQERRILVTALQARPER